MANYGNKRLYRITGVDKSKTPLSPFSDQKIARTFKEYYEKHYGLKIKDHDQYLMIAENKKKPNQLIYLIPELLQPTGLTPEMRKDYKTMDTVAKDTKIDPQTRSVKEKELIQKIN